MSTTSGKLALLCLVVPLAVLWTSVAYGSPALVYDPNDGRVLYAKEPDRHWYPASITKLMTAYVTFEALRANRIDVKARLPVTELANQQEPTRLWLYVETTLSLETVLGATIIKSANDAAVMLANGVGGTLAAFTPYGACRTPASSWTGPSFGSPPHPMKVFRTNRDGLGAARYDDATGPWERCRFDAFIARMNETARRLGMTRTTYFNPNGLPDRRQVTTARDMARLASAIIHDFPEHAALFAKKSMRYGRGRLRSYNGLLRSFPGADGMKTGFTCASGFNIVASATREGRKIVAVVMGRPSSGERNTRTQKLLKNGFETARVNTTVRTETVSSLPVIDDLDLAAIDIRDQLRTRSCRSRKAKRKRKPAKVSRKRSTPKKQVQGAVSVKRKAKAVRKAKSKPKKKVAQTPSAHRSSDR